MSVVAVEPNVISWPLLSSQQEDEHRTEDPTISFLVVSPYTEEAHLLNLSTVSIQCQLLARALTVMTSVRTDYATAPYVDAFNWAEIVNNLQLLAKAGGYRWTCRSFYIVVFRSQIPPSTDRRHLSMLDRKSHEEAIKSGGLLKYWFGVPDTEGRNLATCIWRDHGDAKGGSSGEGHRRASIATRGLYSEWHIERLRLRINDGAENWKISNWVD